jgi:ABC-2 type transport system permease protein
MKFFKLLIINTYYTCLELFRQPMYIVSTILFPSMFFWFFGIPNAKAPGSIQLLMSSFACFAILSVVLFQFGVGISQEKDSSWYYYLRSLPYPRGILLSSRVLSGLLFSIFGVGGVVVTALLFSDLHLSDLNWFDFSFRIYVGAVPFALMGICLGLAASSRSVLPLANLIYLPLSFAGGLWMPPQILPTAVQKISPYLPTRMYGEILWALVMKKSVEEKYFWGLGLYTLVFLTLALLLYRKEEERSFR